MPEPTEDRSPIETTTQQLPSLSASPTRAGLEALWQDSLSQSTTRRDPTQSIRGTFGQGPCSSSEGRGDTTVAAAIAERISDPEEAMRQAWHDLELGVVVGRGGMGVVYRAWQQSLQREVAVKQLNSDSLGPDTARAFITEAAVAAYLDHPNILPVYFVAVDPDGAPAIAMKLIEGQSWTGRLEADASAAKEPADDVTRHRHLELLLQLCHAVSYAHSKGIVHCDLKPDNVLIGDYGEVVLMDWGVALDVSVERAGPWRARRPAEVRSPFGTPNYMAPELANGASFELGPWTDVYLLGAILHEILTGSPPHRRDSLIETLYAAATSEAPRFESEVPAELAAVCRRALAGEPSARFESAESFAEALRAYLAHQESLAVSARAERALESCRARSDTVESKQRHALYDEFTESIAAFRQAQLMWPGNEAAQRGERDARVAFAGVSLARGDLGVAEAQLEALEASGSQTSWLRDDLLAALGARRRVERAARRLRSTLLISASLLIVLGLFGGLSIKRARDDAQRQLEQYSELADLVRVRDSLSSAKELWPAITRTIAPMETWLLRARRLTARRVGHEARLRALLSSETSPASGGTRERTQRRWHRQQLEELLRRLAKLETTTQGVSERLAQARSSWQRNAAYARLWKETRARIADVARSPRYRALELDPIEGLAPLGCDPDSSLEEFALIDTGALPRRDARGHLTLESGSAAVLVLLPAGRYAIGSHDDDGKENEHPRHEVTIRRPFMLGKHEVTQGQWLRLMGINPSQQPEGLPTDARELYPVDSVSWNRATEFARRLGCGLPSEAQWEYACRAGTATRWWTGDELSSLRGRVNLADRSHSQEPEEGTTEAWADGFATSAPVSSYEPNAFGLHELAGNLWEWCEDEYSERHDRTHSDERPRRTGDGRYVTSNGAWRWTPRAAPQTHTSGATERVASSEAASRYHVTRGGSWDDAGYELRSANRLSGNSTGGFDDDGLRLFRALD